MAAEVRPYLVPPPEAITWDAWSMKSGDEWVPLSAAIDGWDPGTQIRLRRSVRIDVERLLATTGLESVEQLAVTTSWTSSTSGMTESVPPMVVPRSGVLVVDVVLPGARVGGIVRLRSTLSVISPPPTRQPAVAWIPGSVLGEDETRLALEGTLSMFPVHDLDFARTRLPPLASWHLETSTDLDAPFLGTFRLLLNSRDTELLKAVARGAKDRRQTALLETLQADVACLLLELAVLLADEISVREVWFPDTVGDVLQRVLRAARAEGDLPPPAGAHDTAEFRTRLDGAVRASGQGRTFT